MKPLRDGTSGALPERKRKRERESESESEREREREREREITVRTVCSSCFPVLNRTY